ncbi:MAG TPA: enoyl-CoA hydratase-related protein [Chitinophagales bacterium]|nr:enoyl-CoA hydratase-related protein [Chitinophagales bacterium]
MYNLITYNAQDGLATLTLNRPDKMNALNIALLGELDRAIDEALADETVRGIVITGSGTKAFAAGADIGEFANFSPQQAKDMSAGGHAIFDKIESSTKPVIAAINGFALGGGCELAMSCHMRVASDNAKFGQPEVNLGLIPGYGGTQRLLRYVGLAKGIELLLTADTIDANEAHRLGLVNHVTTQDDLLPRCKAILDKIKTKSPLAVARVLACANAYESKTADGFAAEIDAFGESFGTQDFKEGTAAFLEKRNAAFTGK